jgi:transcriptional regulator with XRE-family HTH domain
MGNTKPMSKRKIPEHHKNRFIEMSLFLKNYRANERLSMSEFSKLADTHVNTIQRFEKGNKNITVLTLFDFIDAMDISLPEFFEGMN